MQDTTSNISGAQAVMQSLAAENVDTIFGYPGGAIMPIYDALYDYKDSIQHILVRHEQGAIHAAQGYARASGKVGVCFATSGPGATNLITGLADAMIDSTPVVCITGQVAAHLLGTDAFQETDVIGISMPITKWNLQVTRPQDIAPAIAKAFFIAKSGRPGPVLIDITKDAQFGSTAFEYEPCARVRSFPLVPKPNSDQIQQAAQLLSAAAKPLILVGQGVILAQAEAELLDLATHIDAPVASTLLGLGAFPPDHPLYVGYLGMHGNYAPNVKTNEADVILAVGMRFDDRVTGDVSRYARQAKIIHIDIDKAEINKIIPATVGIHADAKPALAALRAACQPSQNRAWRESFVPLQAEENQRIILPNTQNRNDELNMAEVVHLLSQRSEGRAIVTTDVGQHQMITARYFEYRHSRRNITSGGLGTMGFALPAAIGAKLGAPHLESVAIIGDGGFQMTIQELGTILQHKIPVKLIILNNNFLGMVRQWQQLFFDKRYAFTEIVNPDFVAVAAAYSIPAQKVDSRERLGAAIDELLGAAGPYLLEVVVAREENVFPMVPTGASVSEIRLD